jgi:uncharacterized Zn-finger protein
MESYPKFHNEVGVSIVHIGCREFKCIGDKPPQDHPHIYLNMGDTGEIICPYCSTLFRFDPSLGAREAEPAYCACGDVDWFESFLEPQGDFNFAGVAPEKVFCAGAAPNGSEAGAQFVVNPETGGFGNCPQWRDKARKAITREVRHMQFRLYLEKVMVEMGGLGLRISSELRRHVLKLW